MPILLSKVYSGLSAFGRGLGSYPALRMKKLETLASPGINSIMYKSVIEGDTSDYLTYVQFFEVKYKDEKDDEYTEAENIGNKVKYHKKPSVSSNPVALKCSCSDFRFTFEKQLFDKNGLIGAFRKYTKVAGSNRPPRNPGNHLGLCKHVHNLINILRNNGRITG